ncbi:MAG: DUF4870 domain-containing protein [Minisyncoccia bacterium]
MEETKQEPTASGDQKAPEKNVLMAILAYIGPLILISYLIAKDDPFVKFHIKQGLLLVIGEVATWMIMMTIWILFPLLQLVNLAIFVLAIIGIVRAAQGQEKPLPLIGHFAKSFDF